MPKIQPYIIILFNFFLLPKPIFACSSTPPAIVQKRAKMDAMEVLPFANVFVEGDNNLGPQGFTSSPAPSIEIHPFFLAVLSNDFQEVGRLMDLGLDINMHHPKTGETPLDMAPTDELREILEYNGAIRSQDKVVGVAVVGPVFWQEVDNNVRISVDKTIRVESPSPEDS